MFIDFYYKLREAGIPVSPTSFLTLHKALGCGLVNSLDEFYLAARTILIKSERCFDCFDLVFAHFFEGAELPEADTTDLDEMARILLEEWLRDPRGLADALDADESILSRMSPDELIDYFKQRLKDQTGRHDGGSKWIGTGGTSPVGHSGFHPGGLRVGGVSRNRSAVKVAMERRYRDYSLSGPLTQAMVGEALKRLRHMTPTGPKDRINIDASIYQTMKNAGEIEIVFDRSLRDRLKVILAIDNGGWSMDPYIPVVQTLFDYAKAQFKDLKTYYFHNAIYDFLWEDPARNKKPKRIEEFSGLDPETRLVLVGDASMAPFELMAAEGSLYVGQRSSMPSVKRLHFLAKTFTHSVWLNPVSCRRWDYTHTIRMIREIFPMFELSIDGLECAVDHLRAK